MNKRTNIQGNKLTSRQVDKKLTTCQLVNLLTCQLIIMTLLTACSADPQYSTTYPCNFYFDTGKHPTSIQTRSLDNPGMWTFVSVRQSQGINHVMVTPNNGDAEDIAMTTEIENHRVNYNNMGADNGIIVGCSNFSGIRAYDRQCPKCLDNARNSALEWDDNRQMVKCQSCQSAYMLENGSCTTAGIRLLEYKVAFSGPGSPLQVHN